MNIVELKKKAEVKFNEKNMKSYFSPGRVNLIGEHIDYNGGLVLPCALDIGTTGFISKRDDRLVSCYSDNFEELGIITFSLDDLVYKEEDNWTNYVKGVIKEMDLPFGFNIFVIGEIPNGSGLSSSASLELLVGVSVNDVFSLNYTNLELVKISQICENNFIGVNSGIMDQFVIGMAEASSAMLLNTSTLEFKSVKIDLADYVVLIANTNKKRTLASSKYNERRAECEKGLKLLQNKYDIKELCELNNNDFEDSTSLLTDETILKRVRHVVSENERTKIAYNALKASDLIKFGELLNESHRSLKEDYEVTGLELDTMQELFIKNGSIGARMTGAGFGGCVIGLVLKDKVDEVSKLMSEEYQSITNLKADFYPVNIGNGARKI